MPKPKDEKKIDQIFKATLKLVAKNGFSGLRMGDVAKAAGIATGTLYIYFKDKQTLVNALYLHLKQDMASRYIIKDDFSKPYKQMFDAIWKKYFLVTLENRQASAFIEQYYMSHFYDKKKKDEAHQSLQLIYELLDRGKKEKLIKNIDNALLIAQVNGPILDITKMITSGNIENSPQTIHWALQMAWDAIKR
jgi:AcrR family transcriptional regulator